MPFAEKDSFGVRHQSQMLRLLADITTRQGRNTDGIQTMRHAMTVTEDATRQLGEGPLSFGADQNTRDLTQSVDQAVTLALAAQHNASLSAFAAEAVLRARGRQLALSAARLRELHLLPLGAEPTMRELRLVRTRLSGAPHPRRRGMPSRDGRYSTPF
jgi:hypothetical protein